MLALVGLRRPPPLRRLRASLHRSPVGCLFRRYPRLHLALLRLLTRTLALLRCLLVALQVGPPRFSSAPPGTPRDSGSEDSDSGSSSASAALDSAAVQLADLVYDFCPEARPVSDSAPPPRCRFESWFDPSPISSSSRPRYRVYPRVAAVESEVADRAAALHHRSKPLSAVFPLKICRYAVADLPLFAAPQPLNPSFSRLAGASAVGSKRWGSVAFEEMERLERLFRC